MNILWIVLTILYVVGAICTAGFFVGAGKKFEIRKPVLLAAQILVVLLWPIFWLYCCGVALGEVVKEKDDDDISTEEELDKIIEETRKLAGKEDLVVTIKTEGG